jgi:hypothetical protein
MEGEGLLALQGRRSFAERHRNRPVMISTMD